MNTLFPVSDVLHYRAFHRQVQRARRAAPQYFPTMLMVSDVHYNNEVDTRKVFLLSTFLFNPTLDSIVQSVRVQLQFNKGSGRSRTLLAFFLLLLGCDSTDIGWL
jgi:hypothetical protein